MDDKASARWNAEMRNERQYKAISGVLGWLVAVVTFIGIWIATITQWGWILGIAFGWIPALITAAIAGLFPLSWYDAYNAVKHDREHEFAQGTLKAAFEAVSACAIMITAQFGQYGFGRGPELYAQFDVTTPDFRREDYYLLPDPDQSSEWAPTNYPFVM